jgi:cellulose biosynthesis protein BcsQ
MTNAALATQSQPRGKILMSFIPKGGVGKTAIASHLIVSAANAGYSVLGVDFDQQQSLTNWSKDRVKHPSYAQMSKFDMGIAEIKDWQDVFASAREYDVTVLDMPPSVTGVEAEIHDMTAAADFILMPTGTSKRDWEIAIDWMARFKERGLRNVKFVLSKIPDTRRNSYQRAQTLLSQHGLLMPSILPLREDIANAIDIGLTANDVCDAKGNTEFSVLWNSVRQEINL